MNNLASKVEFQVLHSWVKHVKTAYENQGSCVNVCFFVEACWNVDWCLGYQASQRRQPLLKMLISPLLLLDFTGILYDILHLSLVDDKLDPEEIGDFCSTLNGKLVS